MNDEVTCVFCGTSTAELPAAESAQVQVATSGSSATKPLPSGGVPSADRSIQRIRSTMIVITEITCT